MRKIYNFIFIFATVSVFSQTLTQAIHEPVVGDIDRNFRLDTSAYTTGLPNTVSGNNVVWDFSKLFGVYPLVVDSFLSASAVLSSSLYPGTSFVRRRDAAYSYYKSTTSPQQTELLGGNSGSLTVTFTNSGIVVTYPVNYGYNLTDPVSGTFKYNGTNGAGNGSITITADGLGTVNLNGQSIPNVLRLKSVEILTLSTAILPFGTFNQTIYNYYLSGKRFPFLSVNYTIYQLLAGTPTITAYVYGNNDLFNTLGVKEAKFNESFRAFPNPFRNNLHINQEMISEDNTYSFYTISGQLVLTSPSLNDAELEKLNAGIYFLEVKNKNGIRRQKVIKE